MGNLILTSSKKTVHSYYSTELGIHLYSAEELCYFIYNNLMLLDESFLDDRLKDFIRNELELPETADKLDKWRDSCDFGELLLMILQDIHYYSGHELMRFSEELVRIRKEGSESIFLEKGDYLFSIGKYYAALNIYNKLLTGRNGIMSDRSKRALVYEHIGFSFARLFDYGKALASFINAYKNDPQPRYRKDIYFISRLSLMKKEPEELLGVPEEVRSEWDDEYGKAVERTDADARVMYVDELMSRDEIKKQKGLTSLAYKLKDDYRRSQG